MDGCGSRDKVEELRDLAVQRGRFHRIHGCNEEVVCLVAFDALYEGSLQGSIDVVPDGHGRGGEG